MREGEGVVEKERGRRGEGNKPSMTSAEDSFPTKAWVKAGTTFSCETSYKSSMFEKMDLASFSPGENFEKAVFGKGRKEERKKERKEGRKEGRKKGRNKEKKNKLPSPCLLRRVSLYFLIAVSSALA